MGGGGGGTCDLDMSLMDETTSLNTLGGFVFILLLFATLSGNTDFHAIQRANLPERLGYVSHMNVYFCLISIFCYVVHIVGALMHVDHGLLNKMSYGEYLLTCPLMMISFVILGGPRVKDAYRAQAFSLTVLVIAFGAVATVLESKVVAMVCFLFASGFFATLIFCVNLCVKEHSMGKEELFKGAAGEHFSAYKKLGRKLFFTWMLFPIWWLFSSDGLALATASEVANSAVKLMMNIVAKGMYILFIRLLQHQYAGKAEMIEGLEEEIASVSKMDHVESPSPRYCVDAESLGPDRKYSNPRHETTSESTAASASQNTQVCCPQPRASVLNTLDMQQHAFKVQQARAVVLNTGSLEQQQLSKSGLQQPRALKAAGSEQRQDGFQAHSNETVMAALAVLGSANPAVLKQFGLCVAQPAHIRMTDEVDMEFMQHTPHTENPFTSTCDPGAHL